MSEVGWLLGYLVGWLRFEVLLLLASCSFLLVKVGYPCNQVSSSLGSRVYLAETEGGNNNRRYIYYLLQIIPPTDKKRGGKKMMYY